MDTFFGHSSFIGFVHVSSRARFVHHGKLRSASIKIRSPQKTSSVTSQDSFSQKASFVTSQDSFSRKVSFVTSQVSLITNQVSFITSFVFGGQAGRVIISIYNSGFGRNLIEGCLELFSRLRYGTLVGEWISSFLAAPPCRVHPPHFPSLPHRRTQSFSFTDNHSCAYGNNTNYEYLGLAHALSDSSSTPPPPPSQIPVRD